MTNKEKIENTNKKIILSVGFGSINVTPTTWKKPVDKEEALRTIDWAAHTDIKEYDDYVDVHCYSACDMW